MSDNIKVVVKVRPLISREVDDKLFYQWRINNNTLYQIDQNGKDAGPSFTFDKVYDTKTKTDDVYNDIAKPIVEAATAGFNGTIFAYGQTSSGKTYTMTGTDEAPGLIPLAVLNLFDIIKTIPDRDFLVRVSYVEIYNESLIDLLDIKNPVTIKESFHGVKVNTTEKPTVSPEEVLELMRQGKANRQTGSTNMNEESSRSHSIFQITIESREHIEGEQEVGSVNVSQLNLVDLAGSERAGQTGATGLRFKEGTHINKSLSTLALVIKQLSENQNKHVNYRDSKLTRILQNSLGGNAKTSIICAVTPAAVEETISTLQFANRAKAIKNTPAVNLVATDATMIQSLTKQLSSLKTQLECKKHVEQDNYNLQRQIANLQRLILNSFGNSRNTDIISGARRKLQQPRRVTISTLHPIEEDPLPAVPKFCTPSLKYNPLSLGVPEYVPLQGARSLSSVSEERAITPPAREFPDEVIEIDSDEDTASDIQPCSPYHSCYQSKTPPCILRKTAKQAEKNLKDIVELTEREKIYTPNVIELMEKLEDKSLVIAKLEDDISNLNSISKEKDKELGTLKSKIADAEEEIKNIALVKEKLEETCKEYSTKLTDWEVSYETLKKKSRSREEELLSLLQEHENRKKRSIAKLSSKAIENELKNFMDLSRDISLVNSSIENSIIETEVKPTESDLKEQLTMRDQTILQLEANLHAQKLKIDNLENVNEKIQGMLTSLNEKISLLVDENAILKTAVDSLTSTVSNQKSHIDTANADIESYCSVIKEMRAKLANRDDAKEMGDEDLEAMLANEGMFVANNENVKNIIQSLKKALETRDEELKKLKSDLDGDENLCLELEIHKNEIATLKKDVERLRSEATDNISIINTMVQEKNSMINVEKQLASKLTEIIEEKDSLEKAINSHTDEITKLKDSNNKLSLELNGKHEEILSIKEKNNLQIKDISQKVNKLELTVKNKEEIIENLKKEQSSTEDMIGKAKLGLCKIKNIITLLTGDVNEIPEFVDNLVDAFSSLGDNLTVVEDIARDIMKEKQDAFTMLEQRETELKSLKTTINDLGDRVDAFCDEYENLIQEHVEEKIMKRDELLNGAANVCDRLNNKINNLLYAIKITQNALVRAISEKKSELDESKIRHENVSKQLELESHRNKTHVQHIDNLTSSRFLTLKRILEKVTNLTSKFNIENSVSCQFDDDAENLYELVMLTIDKVDNYIAVLNTEHSKCDNVESVLGDAKNKILQLTDENLKLVQGIADLETDKAVLNDEIKRVQKDSKSLTKQLRDTSDLMNELHRELSAKSSEIETIENNTKTWRDKFFDLEVSMQDRIDVLETENVELKSKCSELELHELPKCDDNGDSLACGDRECYYRRRNNYIQANSPPSLVTICCHRIADAMDLNDDRSLTSSSSCTELSDSKLSTNKCQCKDLLADVEKLMDEKRKLNGTIEKLQNENDNLMRERLDVQREVQLLSEHSCELQKRLLNHRTVLSTLTATTYAENKSLSSQIKFLQHHHNRFHHVCQKDIPAFKKQLQDLMALLKTEYLGRQNETFKRYSLPNALDASSLHSTFKNESAFDLLMLDTNVTLTTCDNTMTMVGHDQTCFDATHVVVTSEVACQTNEMTKSSLYPQMDSQLQGNRYIEAIESIKSENHKLRDLVDEYSGNKSKVLVTTMSSPIKMPDCPDICKKCDKYISDIRLEEESHGKEIEALSKRLNDLEIEKSDILEKYNNLSLEMLSSDALIKKINHLENEIQTKQNDIRTVTATLNKTNKTLSVLQEENNSLSNEVIDNISEIDILRGEQESLKEINRKLTEKCVHLEEELKRSEPEDRVESVCDRCTLKEETINNLQKRLLMSETHSKLDRSYSDADSSSRYNKICTLQNELHAGKEDCIELKEEVTTIKKHLEHSNLSMSQNMDLDESIVDSHVYSFNKDYGNTNQNKFVSSDVPQRQVTDVYAYDRTECLNYYCEKSGVDKDSFNTECKIVDIMKMLFVDFTTKHATEVENLVNRLKHFEEAKTDLQAQLNEVNGKQLTTQKDLKEKECYLQRFADVVSCVRQNITAIDRELGADDVVITFRDTFLKIIDTEFGFASSNIFEVVTDKLNKKHNEELEVNAAEIARLKESTQEMVSELSSVNENLLALKSRLSDKESEFDLLQRQKDKMHEISKAVTIDLIKREKEFRDQLTHYYSRLLENNIIQNDIDLSLPLNASLDILFKNILNKFQNKDLEEEKLSIVSELEKLKTILQQKDDEIHSLRDNLKREVTEVERKLKTQISLHDDLNKIYAKKVEENEINSNTISKLTEEVNLLKENVLNKEKIIASLETRQSEAQAKELEHIKSLQNNQKELEELKAVNGIILKEKERCATELESAREMLARQKLEIDNMTSLIDSLKQSVHESTRVVESLNIKSDTLLEENNLLQKQLQEKCSNCARLEINIKTHEKTAAIQTKIINRLQTQKAEYDKSNSENEKQIEAVTEKCKSLEGECLKLATEKQTFKEEIEKLNALKHTMELRISELESVTHPRLSIDSASETARRRRQSIHDSKRMFAEDDEDHEKIEAVSKSCPRADDPFMEVDDDSSSRSTPARLSRGRDSLLSKHDQSDTGSEQSRPGSVAASRRRRQSAHDRSRSVAHAHPARAHAHAHESSHETSGSFDGEAAQLGRLPGGCREELEQLRRRCRELDEECDTCALYLRERDEQCARLKRDKTALENTIAKLREKLQTMTPYDTKNIKSTFKDATVNTEEDWTNLHSVVVDRMSYDAEVEKNKKLMRTIEELRFKKQDLKNTMAKMQKALEKTSNRDNQELESTKAELAKCKQEIEELKERNKELDDECETCAEYLREREQQCQKLKEAKAALEARLEEYQQSSVMQSVRKRRHTLHDRNRLAATHATDATKDAATDTGDDLLSYQVERDECKIKLEDSKEIKRLKLVVDRLTEQKASLEQQLASTGSLYVATGSAIVQNQQLSDVMKENQKLKKMNAKLVTICKKRGKSMVDSNRENEDPSQQAVGK